MFIHKNKFLDTYGGLQWDEVQKPVNEIIINYGRENFV